MARKGPAKIILDIAGRTVHYGANLAAEEKQIFYQLRRKDTLHAKNTSYQYDIEILQMVRCMNYCLCILFVVY